MLHYPHRCEHTFFLSIKVMQISTIRSNPNLTRVTSSGEIKLLQTLSKSPITSIVISRTWKLLQRLPANQLQIM